MGTLWDRSPGIIDVLDNTLLYLIALVLHDQRCTTKLVRKHKAVYECVFYSMLILYSMHTNTQID